MEFSHRVVITGGPGTGKTSIINKLRDQNYTCYTERARATIKEQMEVNTDLVPWENLVDFSKLVAKRQLSDYHLESKSSSVCFYDRGVPDVLAYLHRENYYVPVLEELAKKTGYHKKVFITPPWQKIYVQDEERKEDLATMESIHHALHNTYTTLGYDVIEVPKIDLKERVDFIKTTLGL